MILPSARRRGSPVPDFSTDSSVDQTQHVLTINAGSSSVRFAVFDAAATTGALRPLLAGKLDRIGQRGTNLVVEDTPGGQQGREQPAPRVSDHGAAARYLLRWLEEQPVFASIDAVGHRVVHGMTRTEPARVTPKLIADLRRITPYAPEHLPRELALIEALARRHPDLPQVACFDTAFHRTMPRVATLLPIPRRYASKGVARYGFHGLSYAYLMEELARVDPAATRGRVILAHLGSGASMAAVRDGRSVDTSMGFTPAAGLVMGTRTGDLDPGLVYYLARVEGMTPPQFQRMVSHEGGLLAVSATSADLRDLLAREARDTRAAEAVALFCYQAKKWIGSFAAALGGVDTLVFAGGIGENTAIVRARICDGLGFLGIELDETRNARHAALVSPDAAPVKVRIIPTNEELMIARSVAQVLGLGAHAEHNPGPAPAARRTNAATDAALPPQRTS